VNEDDALRSEALDAGGPHVVLLQRLDGGGADQPRDVSIGASARVNDASSRVRQSSQPGGKKSVPNTRWRAKSVVNRKMGTTSSPVARDEAK
jgi:hypothetical protein